MAGLGPMVAALWREMGMAPPPETIGTSYSFELGPVALTLDLADNGETVIVRGRIGYLEGNVHEAGDQLGRVQRLGLGMTALNAAVLDAAEAEDILEKGHQGRVPVYAVALAQLPQPASILPAIRAVLDWQTATEQILLPVDTEGEGPATRPAADSSAGETEMIIFQP